MQDFTLVLVELHKVLAGPLFQPIQVLVAVLSKVSTSPLSLVSSANFIRVYFIPSFRSFMKILNSVVSNINPWGTSLVTGCQFEEELFTTTLWVHPFSQLPTHHTDHLSRL